MSEEILTGQMEPPEDDPMVISDPVWPGVYIRVKKMTVRDGAEHTRLTVQITTDHVDDTEGEFDHLLTTLLQHYPIIVCATEVAEGVPWPMSMEDFWTIPEDLMLTWADLCREVNPQHNLTLVDQKKLSAAWSRESDETGSSETSGESS